jgi:hypothetical protein
VSDRRRPTDGELFQAYRPQRGPHLEPSVGGKRKRRPPEKQSQRSAGLGGDASGQASTFATYLATHVPRADAIGIVRLIADDIGVQAPAALDTDFKHAVAQFTREHLSPARVDVFLGALRDRKTRGSPWIAPAKRSARP